MKAQPLTAARQHPHFSLAKSQLGVVESADLLGLGEIHPLKHHSVKQTEKTSSNPPACVLSMPPSHPSISTALKVGAAEVEKHVSPPPCSPRTAQSVTQPTKIQETAQDHARRINQEINNNEKKLSETEAIGYVPPHLRPPQRESADDTEDAYGNYIPPHLRRPRDVNGRARVSSPANTGWGGTGCQPMANRPHKVSVVLTPISQVAGKQTADIPYLIQAVKPAAMAMPSAHRGLMSVQVKQPTKVQQSAATAPHLLLTQDPSKPELKSTAASRLDSSRRKAVSPPPPPPIGGTKIKTAYFPLRPETPPPPPARRRGDVSSHGNQESRQESRSSFGRSNLRQDDDRGDFLILDHERTRKTRSYTHYRSKSGFAPHNPRLPFEFLHKIYGPNGATYAETLGERHDSSSMISPGFLSPPDNTNDRPSTHQGYIIPSNTERGYKMPKHEHIKGYNSRVALSSSSEAPTVEADDLIFNTWPQPPGRSANKRHRKSRSVILSGLSKMATWEQISRVCKETGKVENMEISKKDGMAMVTFVEASTAQHFYETTDARGILLVYIDEETNDTVNARIRIDMNPEIVAIEDSIHELVDTEGASRVLEIIGWTRDILESMVGGPHEGGIGYSDLLMRLASLYCPPERVQCVDWRQNEEGHMEVRFVYAGIKNAVRVCEELDKESALGSCKIIFGSDPLVPPRNPGRWFFGILTDCVSI